MLQNYIKLSRDLHFQYHKQTQLETMVSQKAAAEFQLEKVIMRHQEIQVGHLLMKFRPKHCCNIFVEMVLRPLFLVIYLNDFQNRKLKELHHPVVDYRLGMKMQQT